MGRDARASQNFREGLVGSGICSRRGGRFGGLRCARRRVRFVDFQTYGEMKEQCASEKRLPSCKSTNSENGWGRRLSKEFLPGEVTTGSRLKERRAFPRYVLVTDVQIEEPIAKIHLSGRTAEISLGGCYIDLLNTLPKGTVIRLAINSDKGLFCSWGCVVYVQEGIGMGVKFLDTAPEHTTLLKKWIDELRASDWNAL